MTPPAPSSLEGSNACGGTPGLRFARAAAGTPAAWFLLHVAEFTEHIHDRRCPALAYIPKVLKI